MRVFVAIDLEPELKKALQDVILKLKKTGAEVGWVNSHAMHLTLKFLGETAADRIPVVEQVVRQAVSARARFPLLLRGTGTFPDGRPPRVLWAGIAEDPGLMDLQKEIDDGLAMQGFPAEERAFHPHLTLGRVRSQVHVREAVLELDKYRDAVFGQMTVQKVTLFESILKPQGTEYRAASEFELP